jgi:hypothetical protein
LRAIAGTASKKASASSMVISRTSWMLAALVADIQGLAVVALALADIAGHVDVRQEVHLHLRDAVPLAGLAAPALDVEAEAPGLVAARARFLGTGEQLANRGENAGVGRRVRARRATDRALVDIDALVDMLQALDGSCAAGVRVVAPLRAVAATG